MKGFSISLWPHFYFIFLNLHPTVRMMLKGKEVCKFHMSLFLYFYYNHEQPSSSMHFTWILLKIIIFKKEGCGLLSGVYDMPFKLTSRWLITTVSVQFQKFNLNVLQNLLKGIYFTHLSLVKRPDSSQNYERGKANHQNWHTQRCWTEESSNNPWVAQS